MSAMREELHQLVDQLPEAELRPALELIRGRVAEHGGQERDLPFFASFEAESDLAERAEEILSAELVFTTRTGRPIEPRNFVRSFRRICDGDKIRLIKVHHVRHMVGSLLKDLGVPARDAQTILGHTRISTTLEIYTDTDEQARRDALARLQSLLGDTQN